MKRKSQICQPADGGNNIYIEVEHSMVARDPVSAGSVVYIHMGAMVGLVDSPNVLMKSP